MSWQSVAADVLLALAVALVVSGTAGVVVFRDPSDKVHAVGPLAMTAPVLVAIAITLRSGWSEPTGQTWLAVAVVLIAGPVVSHATVRAARARRYGDWRARDGVVRSKGHR